MTKAEFIQGEIWMLTFNAAFQRANVFKPNLNKQEEQDKQDLKTFIKLDMEGIILPCYHSSTSDEKHIDNINEIRRRSTDYKHILNNGSFSFGVCQKILNLYLKYLWSLDMLKYTPPHFPVDRIIQSKLGISKPVSWTIDMDEKQYMQIIEKGRSLLSKHNKDNVAELELYLFERRN
jgi:hypothetical protein